MNLAKLLRQTAIRYEAAVQRVLAQWTPQCGCARPGARPGCEACPCLPQFEELIRQEIQRSVNPPLVI